MRTINIKKLNFVLLVMIFSIGTACGKKEIDFSKKEYSDLKVAIQKYYQLEKERRWSETYAMRTPSFRRVVEKDTYISMMEEDAEGWVLHEFSVLSAVEIKGEVFVEMNFLESFPKGSDFGRSLNGQYNKSYFDDYSVWKKINGKWYCKAAAARAHLSLNPALEE